MLIAGLALFVAALVSPAIVYKPDARSNPKRSECAFAVQDDVACESFAFGGSGMATCAVVGSPTVGKTFVEKAKILEFCKGWDAPTAARDYGINVLLKGFLGIAVGMFAWFANPLMLLALLLSALGRRLASIIAAASAITLGAQSYMFDAVPFNETSMSPSDLNFVDHLGIGFYLWMGSLVAFSAYCFLKPGGSAALGTDRSGRARKRPPCRPIRLLPRPSARGQFLTAGWAVRPRSTLTPSHAR